MSKIEITPELLADLKAKAEKATPGPWESSGSYVLLTEAKNIAIAEAFHYPLRCTAPIDAAYIAAANPQVVLALLDEVKNLRFNFEALRNFLDNTEIKTPEEIAMGCYTWINALLVQRDKERKNTERLEKEADWLAARLAKVCSDGNCPQANIDEWREAARKAVGNDNA